MARADALRGFQWRPHQVGSVQSDRPDPVLTHHRGSGQGVVRLDGRDFYCGVWGLGKEARQETRERYHQLLARWHAADKHATKAGIPLTIGELMVSYLAQAKRRYRTHDRTRPNDHYWRIARELRPLRQLYGSIVAAEFTGLELLALRDGLIEKRWAQSTINHAIGSVRAMFRWAATVNLVPVPVSWAMDMVKDLQRGESDAPPPRKVEPVAETFVEQIKPYVSKTIWNAIRLQLVTGARPGEILSMTTGDVDTAGAVWIYRPKHHKTEKGGHVREIYLGPQAREILAALMREDLTEPIFSASESAADRLQARRASRKTKLWPSMLERYERDRKPEPKRRPGKQLCVNAYRHAIARACALLYPPPGNLARRDGETIRAWRKRLTPEQRKELNAWRRTHRFHPHQLRHTFATRIRQQHGVEASQVLLGHKTISATQIYAEKNVARAIEIAAQAG